MVDHELNELKREFLEEADEKAKEIAAILAGDRTSQTLDRLAYLAHQLKGSGGSYGYQRISSDGAELEKAFEALARGEAADEQQIRGHVDSLQSEIATGLADLRTT